MKKIFLSLLMAVAAISAQQLIAQTQINQANSPYFISQSGSYILTSNVNVPSDTTAIWVEASNVTINLNGFTISGPCPATGCSVGTEGIYVYSGYSNTTVENGQVTGFAYGVDIQSGEIHDLNVTNGDYCIFAANATIRHNVVSACAEDGIYAQNSSISDNIVSQSSDAGIVAYYSSIFNNTVTNNTYWGIEAVGGVVNGNTSMHNASSEDLYLAGDAVTTKNNACTSGAC